MSNIETDTYYRKITSSLGMLLETGSSIFELNDESSFGAKVDERVQASTSHFIWRTFNIYSKGKWQDIAINGFLFSKIASTELSSNYYTGSRNTLRLKGINKNQERFEFEHNLISGYGHLVNIVLAMIVISECSNLNFANKVWDKLSTTDKDMSAKQCLDDIETLFKFLRTSQNKYTFLDDLVYDSLVKRINNLKTLTA